MKESQLSRSCHISAAKEISRFATERWIATHGVERYATRFELQEQFTGSAKITQTG